MARHSRMAEQYGQSAIVRGAENISINAVLGGSVAIVIGYGMYKCYQKTGSISIGSLMGCIAGDLTKGSIEAVKEIGKELYSGAIKPIAVGTYDKVLKPVGKKTVDFFKQNVIPPISGPVTVSNITKKLPGAMLKQIPFAGGATNAGDLKKIGDTLKKGVKKLKFW